MKKLVAGLATGVLLVIAIGTVGRYYFNAERDEVYAVFEFRRPEYFIQPTVPDHFDFEEFVQTQRQLFLSRNVLSKAVGKLVASSPLLRDKADPINYVAEHVEASMISPRLMEVRVTGGEFTTKERIELLEAVNDTYLIRQHDVESEQRSHLMSRLKNERQRLEGLLGEQFRSLERLNQSVVSAFTDLARKAVDGAEASEPIIVTKNNTLETELEFARRETEVMSAIYGKIVSRIDELQLNSGSPPCVLLRDTPTVRKR